MSVITRQVDKLIINKIANQDSTLTTQVKFDKNFIGFEGHFPDNPILPGVIIINLIIRMYELYNNKKYRLSQIKQAKFIEPISAETFISFYVKSDIEHDCIKLNGKVSKKEKIISKISLVIQEQE